MHARIASIASVLVAIATGCTVESNFTRPTVGVQGSVVAGGELQAGVQGPQGTVVAPQGAVVGTVQGGVMVPQDQGGVAVQPQMVPQGGVMVQTPGVGVAVGGPHGHHGHHHGHGGVTVGVQGGVNVGGMPPQGGVNVGVQGPQGTVIGVNQPQGGVNVGVQGPQGSVIGVVQPQGGVVQPQGGGYVGGTVQGGVNVGGSITTGPTPSGGSITTGATPGGSVVVTGPNRPGVQAGMLPTAVVPFRPAPGAVITTPTMPNGVRTAPMGATVVTTGTMPGTTPVAPMGHTVVTTGTMPGTTPVAPMGYGTVTGGVVSPTTPGVPGRPTMQPGTVTVSGTAPSQNRRNGVTLAPNPDLIRRPIDPSQIRQPPPPVPSANVVITR